MHSRTRERAVTVRVTTLKGADAGAYYVEALPSYYLQSGEPNGVWFDRQRVGPLLCEEFEAGRHEALVRTRDSGSATWGPGKDGTARLAHERDGYTAGARRSLVTGNLLARRLKAAADSTKQSVDA